MKLATAAADNIPQVELPPAFPTRTFSPSARNVAVFRPATKEVENCETQREEKNHQNPYSLSLSKCLTWWKNISHVYDASASYETGLHTHTRIHKHTHASLSLTGGENACERQMFPNQSAYSFIFEKQNF